MQPALSDQDCGRLIKAIPATSWQGLAEQTCNDVQQAAGATLLDSPAMVVQGDRVPPLGKTLHLSACPASQSRCPTWPPNSFAFFLSLTNTFSTSSIYITDGAIVFAT